MPIFKPTDVRPRPEYRLFVRFEDGVEGEVDLAHLAGRGIFKLWDEANAFEQVAIGPSGQIRWTDDVEICSDAVYLELTGKSASEVFASEASELAVTHASSSLSMPSIRSIRSRENHASRCDWHSD